MIHLPQADYDVVGSIVTYRSDPAELERAVRQFLKVPLKAHLCVVDNSPEPIRVPAYESDAVTYLFAGANLGYGRGHNIALRASRHRSRYNLVMNTDVEYEPEAVCRLKEFLDSNTQAGLAAPQLRYPDGSLQYVCRLLPTPANLFLRRFLPRSVLTEKSDFDYELRWWNHDHVANIPYFQGSFLMLRTELCNELGGFDERFFLYGEDIDLCRRIHGVAETAYVPDAQVTHEYRRYSNGGSMLGTWHGIQNNCRYFNKWGWFLDRDRRRINRKVVSAIRSSASDPTAESAYQP